MLNPALAPVRPRVASPVTGDSVLLEEEVLDLIERGQTGVVVLLGGCGSGKTTAVRHLAAVLPSRDSVNFVDGDYRLPHVSEGHFAICARRTAPKRKVLAQLRLQPWGRDEWIEYLLAVHPEACCHVIPRLADANILNGSPRLCRIVLDALAADPRVPNVRSALNKHLQAILTTDDLRRCTGDFCLLTMDFHSEAAEWNSALQSVRRAGLPIDEEPFLLHRPIRVLLAAEAVVRRLNSARRPTVLHRRLPRAVAEAAGRSLADDEPMLARLRRLLTRRRSQESHAMAASLLRFADPHWRPDRLAKGVNLQGAYLDGVDWSGVRLRKANLTDADFTSATLEGAELTEATLGRAIFRAANLRRAVFTASGGDDVDFSGADLTEAALNRDVFLAADFSDAILTRAQLVGTRPLGADFTRAKLDGAILARASLHNARLDEADLTDAELTAASLQNCDFRTVIVERTSFRGAYLTGANLEDVNWPDAQLPEAHLHDAQLTGSRMHRADLRRANLSYAMLGQIDWEQADLREADLRGASFHMGSAREGLLFSPYASEGTRTGFYTDDYDEQHFKPPEEIRKANLRGCDLRGANIDDVDFYLVDLRDALLDSHQLAYLESCGAILSR